MSVQESVAIVYHVSQRRIRFDRHIAHIGFKAITFKDDVEPDARFVIAFHGNDFAVVGIIESEREVLVIIMKILRLRNTQSKIRIRFRHWRFLAARGEKQYCNYGNDCSFHISCKKKIIREYGTFSFRRIQQAKILHSIQFCCCRSAFLDANGSLKFPHNLKGALSTRVKRIKKAKSV